MMKCLIAIFTLLPVLLAAQNVMFDDPMNDLSNWRYFERKPAILGTVQAESGSIRLKADRGKKLYLYRRAAGFTAPGESLKITFRARGKGCISFFYLLKSKAKKELRGENDIFAVKSKDWKEYQDVITFDFPDIRSALIRMTVWGPADIQIDHFKIERIKK